MFGSGYFWLLVGLVGLALSLTAVYLNSREDRDDPERPTPPGGTAQQDAPHDRPDAN